MKPDKKEFKVNGYAMVEKMIGRQKTCSRVYCPVAWLGKRVVIILQEPPNEE